MTERDLDPLASDLEELLAVERTRSTADPEGKARVRARALSTIFGGGGGGGGGGRDGDGSSPNDDTPVRAAAATSGGGSLARLAAAFALGTAAGGAAVYALVPPRTVERRVEVVVPAPPATSALGVHVHVPEPAPALIPAPAASPSPAAPSVVDSLADERALLDPARVALGRGDASSALDGVAKHEKRHPRGKLTEEREAIAIQALVLAGRKAEALARGQRFLTQHPGSVLVPTVEAAMETAR